MVLLNGIITNNIEGSWISVYLYYADPIDEFIKKAVASFVYEIFDFHLAERFFFIRYFENGPHIRLRMKCKSEEKGIILKNKLNNFFKDYFIKHPSILSEKKYSTDKNWSKVPNNSLKFVRYKPEIGRYGGRYGVKIAEKQFEASSRAVFTIIKEAEKWDYERAIGAALEMHIFMLVALSFTKEDVSAFLKEIYSSALNYCWDKRISHINLEDQIKKYENSFQFQKDKLLPYVRKLIKALEKNSLELKPWMHDWYKSMHDIREFLYEALKQKLLNRSTYLFRTTKDLWKIYYSYIHMTNNRLGIKSPDEPYIAYIIKRCFDSS